MLKIIVFTLCIVAAWSGPADVPIVSQESEVDVGGNYHYSYETGDGTKANQVGTLKEVGDGAGEAVQGAFSYQGDDGPHHVEYTADENGYVPHGDIIHEIPEPIQRALKWIAEHPSKDEPVARH